MTWTYSGDPKGSEKDAVRFLVGDTDSSDPLLQDEEIQYLVDTEGSTIYAAVAAALAISAKFSRLADREIRYEIRVDLSQKAKAYAELGARLRQQATIVVYPTAGGVDRAEKDVQRQDTSVVQPAFRRGMQSWTGRSASFWYRR